MIGWHLHFESITTVAKILCREDGTLLTDQEGSGESYKQLVTDRILRWGNDLLLQPTLSGQTERSDTLRFLTP